MTHPAQPETLDLCSHNLAEDKQQELLRLFPEVRTEGDKIDFERLQLALGDMVDVGKERYGMNWPGKTDCFKTLQAPSLGTLRPCREESVNFDTTENLIIEGDNLEVLKLLQKSYLGKVKMIYIDPPYNTGNDFIYPDDYTESLQTYLEYTGQVDSQGKKFSTNTEANGRFHSKWLNMMHPRLYLARNLLREDGFLVISIIHHDDWELVGEGVREYYATFEEDDPRAPLARYTKVDAEGPYRSDGNPSWPGGGGPRYPVLHPVTGQPCKIPSRGWVWPTYERMQEEIEKGNIVFGLDETKIPGVRMNLFVKDQQVMRSVIFSYAQKASQDFAHIFDGKKVFDNPKSYLDLERLIEYLSEPGDLVVDFFAGTGTTAHGVLLTNRKTTVQRRFICVQLPESISIDTETGRNAVSMGCRTVADICKERVRRVIQKLEKDDDGKLPLHGSHKPDWGFRAFKLAESNFKTWNANTPTGDVAALQQQLELHIDHIRDSRTDEDLLYEILLKSGFPLTTPVEQLILAGKTVYSVAGGALFICLERQLTLDLVRAMAEHRPERVVCLDHGFAGNDQLKTNAVQIFKTKGVTSFKTV